MPAFLRDSRRNSDRNRHSVNSKRRCGSPSRVWPPLSEARGPSHEREPVNKAILGTLAGLVLGAAAAWSVLKQRESEADKAQAREHAEPSRVLHTNGQTLLKLDKEAQANLQVAGLIATSLKP